VLTTQHFNGASPKLQLSEVAQILPFEPTDLPLIRISRLRRRWPLPFRRANYYYLVGFFLHYRQGNRKRRGRSSKGVFAVELFAPVTRGVPSVGSTNTETVVSQAGMEATTCGGEMEAPTGDVAGNPVGSSWRRTSTASWTSCLNAVGNHPFQPSTAITSFGTCRTHPCTVLSAPPSPSPAGPDGLIGDNPREVSGVRLRRARMTIRERKIQARKALRLHIVSLRGQAGDGNRGQALLRHRARPRVGLDAYYRRRRRRSARDPIVTSSEPGSFIPKENELFRAQTFMSTVLCPRGAHVPQSRRRQRRQRCGEQSWHRSINPKFRSAGGLKLHAQAIQVVT